jgi:cell division transport system permease protein
MKVFRILGRNVRDSLKGVVRNFSLSLASISCITITLIVVSIAMLLTYNVNNFASNVEKDVTIVVFMNVDITAEQTDDVLEKIKQIDGIESYTYQSKMQIAEEMMSESDVFKNIMADWTEETSPLQPTYQVKVKDINKIGTVAKQIENIDYVETVKYGEGMIEQLVSVFDVVRKVSIGIVIALIIVTAFLITNTIKITIFSRKNEIDIMRLVGASNINIKIPFILEGLVLGIIGSIIPIILTTYGYTTLYNNFDGQVFSSFIRLVEPSMFIYKLSGLLVAIGIAVGMFGSWRAVRKHLKI